MKWVLRRWLSCCVLLVWAMVAAGCSTGTRLAYNNLDSLVAWQVSDYVDLDASQKAAFRKSFKSIWDWHRQTQLPLYAKDLRGIAGAVADGPPNRTVVDAWSTTVEQRGTDLVNRVAVAFSDLIPMLDDAQVAGIVAHQRKEIDREEDKHADETPEARHKRHRKKVADFFDNWIGDLNDVQKAAVERGWQAELSARPTPEQRRQWQYDDLQRFADLLATRHAPGFRERFMSFGDDDPKQPASEQRRFEKTNQASQRELVTEVLTTLDPGQRTKFQARLTGLAEDCEALSKPRGAS